jgi:hypothetical protein
MASSHHIARRRAEALARQGELMQTLAKRLGVDVPPPARNARQADLQQVNDLDRWNTFLASVIEGLPGQVEAAPEQGERPEPEPPSTVDTALVESMSGMTVREIQAAAPGIDDLATITALLEREQAKGDDARKGAVAAYEARKVTLEGGTDAT